jgi:hypothetical protein
MSLLTGDTGKSQVGSLKTFILTPSTPRETLLTTPLTLPTTEPVTGQISWTIQDTDLPILNFIANMKYNASFICGGKVGVTAATISYRILKNASSVVQTTGASATAAQYWCHSHWRATDVKVGDTFEIRYWASQSDVNLDFYGLIVYPTQPDILKSGIILKDLSFSNLATPSFVSANVVVSNTQGFQIFIWSSSSNSTGVTTATSFYAINLRNGSPIYKLAYGIGENSGEATQQVVNATQRQYTRQIFPSSISFREVLR